MEGFQNIALGFATALQPENLLLCLCGVLLGTFIGTYSSIYISAASLVWMGLKPDSFLRGGDEKDAETAVHPA